MDDQALFAARSVSSIARIDRPASVPVLSVQLKREMHYWLLAGRHPLFADSGWLIAARSAPAARLH